MFYFSKWESSGGPPAYEANECNNRNKLNQFDLVYDYKKTICYNRNK